MSPRTSPITHLRLFLFVVPKISAFRWVRNVNFDYCYANAVSKLNTSDLSDNLIQVFLTDDATGQRLNGDQPLLTLFGCEKLCNDGYQLWPAKETLQRLFFWVVPSLVLISHYHFAPLPATNSLAVIAHLLGDPIDSIWSMLTRQEANRRFHRRAASSSLLPKHAVATIWSAYDEVGWRDASAYFFESLRSRDQEQVPPNQSGGNGPPEGSRRASRSPAGAGQARQRRKARRIRLWNRRSFESQDTNFNAPPDETEIYYIELAAQRLTSNRSESQLTTWVAILTLFGGLGAAYVRTWINRANNQTSHTLAVVVLLFIFISLVKISGNIGSFTSSSAVVDIIQELRRNLQVYNEEQGRRNRRPLFPAFHLDEKARWDSEPRTEEGEPHPGPDPDIAIQAPNRADVDVEAVRLLPEDPGSDQEVENLEQWPSMAGYLGMNSCWRPLKRITTKDNYVYSDREPVTLLVISFLFVIGGSYAPALCLAYFTPLKGFGCRSLAWTLVALMWLVSLIIDGALQHYIKPARKLWRWTVVKDTVVSAWFIGSVLIVQLGLFNSCWCRSGALTNSNPNFINLNPLSDSDWMQGWFLWIFTPIGAALWIFGLIWIVGQGGESARMLLNRDLNTRQQDIIHNNRVRCGLEVEPRDEAPRQRRRLMSVATQLFGRGRRAQDGVDATGSGARSADRLLPSASGANTPREGEEIEMGIIVR
jgi:hypothetical protein